MRDLLLRCDYVATQNSGVVLSGYLFGKPAALFAKIDFHHISANVFDLGMEEAVRRAPTLTPDYDSYLWWFLQEQSIHAHRPESKAKIEAILHNHGWLDGPG